MPKDFNAKLEEELAKARADAAKEAAEQQQEPEEQEEEEESEDEDEDEEPQVVEFDLEGFEAWKNGVDTSIRKLTQAVTNLPGFVMAEVEKTIGGQLSQIMAAVAQQQQQPVPTPPAPDQVFPPNVAMTRRAMGRPSSDPVSEALRQLSGGAGTFQGRQEAEAPGAPVVDPRQQQVTPDQQQAALAMLQQIQQHGQPAQSDSGLGKLTDVVRFLQQLGYLQGGLGGGGLGGAAGQLGAPASGVAQAFEQAAQLLSVIESFEDRLAERQARAHKLTEGMLGKGYIRDVIAGAVQASVQGLMQQLGPAIKNVVSAVPAAPEPAPAAALHVSYPQSTPIGRP